MCVYLIILKIQTSVTDILHAMGAVPSGFRESTLAKLASQGESSNRNTHIDSPRWLLLWLLYA